MTTFPTLSTSDLMSLYSYPIKMTPPQSDVFDFNQPLYPQSTTQAQSTPYAYDLCPPTFDGSFLYDEPTPFQANSQSMAAQSCYPSLELPNTRSPLSSAALDFHFQELEASLNEQFAAHNNSFQFHSTQCSPDLAPRSRTSRAASLTSNARSVQSSISHSSISLNDLPVSLGGMETHQYTHRDISQDRELYKQSQKQKHDEMSKYGVQNDDGRWSCAYPGCTSRSVFNRGCDLRKHYKRHSKTLYCRYEGCPQAAPKKGGVSGFSSKKDRSRHEAKHDPRIVCEWPECGRVFSRHDNMKDHVRRVHQRIQDTIDCRRL